MCSALRKLYFFFMTPSVWPKPYTAGKGAARAAGVTGAAARGWAANGAAGSTVDVAGTPPTGNAVDVAGTPSAGNAVATAGGVSSSELVTAVVVPLLFADLLMDPSLVKQGMTPFPSNCWRATE